MHSTKTEMGKRTSSKKECVGEKNIFRIIVPNCASEKFILSKPVSVVWNEYFTFICVQCISMNEWERDFPSYENVLHKSSLCCA
ncbi:hypothetical protein CEXT_279471 [Caerostris extrusa]|uniref:Uncharacterized protein n=1 Tax=Caerostris extrusa TaxID=172846 RepID=A0AAV4R1R3_CAEEX|nr:hypothetical protein CEXT_279471 [Caerostris extrusa]